MIDNVVPLGNTQRGFTRMDNSIMEALAAVDLPAREFRVVMAIARQTIGYNVQSKRLSADELGKLTNMRRDVVSKAISHLLERRIVFRVGGSRGDIGISPVGEWVFFEEKRECLSETKTSHSAQIVSLVPSASETKTATSLLYSKKEPLVTVPSEQITAPQGAEPVQLENSAGVSFNGEDFAVSPDLITKWAKAYAPVDVESEVARAAAWASGAKPKKDWRRFLVNWLAKAHRKADGAVNEVGVPVDKVIDLYHSVCPGLAAVSVRGDKVLRSLIVERWNESETHRNSQFWRTVFERANRLGQVYFRGSNVLPRLEVICSRAVFRQLEEQA
ncbi:replication protein [Metapseudomonas otitidis]|uniref:replication protein n=1 Tax=Metapseudomonas otitidis TaxID=319939 RepID=UPI00244AE75E|nr:replication protein [Pseudomonas otitidis]MDG9785237.1 replication protein [Pseudomonas otitidis]